MSNRSVQAQHEAMDGSRTHLAVHDTNSPILPVSQMAELHKFRPELVDWVLAETERRERWEETRIWRTDRFIFLERILGQLGGILIAIVGLASATVMALNGHDWAAGTVGSGTLLGIVSLIVTGRKASDSPDSDQTAPTVQPKAKKRHR